MSAKGKPPDDLPGWDLEDAAFLEAMADARAVPDKDLEAEPEERPRSRARRRTKAERGRIETLDLHGMSTEQALSRLDGFIQRTRAVGRREVLVVTGKGYRSEGGVPVLRRAVLRWLRRHGKGRVERVDGAPARLGGSGALVLTLRPRRRS